MTDLTLQPIFLGQNSRPIFSDENNRLTSFYKQCILDDWGHFLFSGFKKATFSADLYRFLTAECSLVARSNREYFWAYYFNAEVLCLRVLLNQFGGNGRSVDFGTLVWLNGPASDLKQALCYEASRLYAPLTQVLSDLEHKHTELGQAWRNFAFNASLPDPGFPQHYLVSENTRNLLAYAARIVAAEQSRPPLQGLQLDFSIPLMFQESS